MDSSGSRLIAFNGDGSFKWRSTTLEAINWGAPAIADLDKDGRPDVVAGNTVYNAVGNFDADPQAEIVLVANGQVWLLKHDMTVKWGPMAIPGGGCGGPPTIADLDGDGKPEIGIESASH